MKTTLTLYTRKDCCLCEEMKGVLRRVAGSFPFTLQELDVDSSAELQEQYGNEVPVLLINGRKAFKYRVSAKELEDRLRKERPGQGIRRSILIAALPAALLVGAAETTEWSLVGREGKCVPLSTLAKRGAEFEDVKSPYQLAEKMRASGHQAEIKEHKAGTRPAVEVRVPSRDLYVMFVKSSTCAADEPGKK